MRSFYRLLWIVFVTVFGVQSTNLPCLAGDNFFQGICYARGQPSSAWSTAETTCENGGRHLTTIRNAFENTYVKTNFFVESTDKMWIGAHYDGSTLTWADGSTTQYANWNNHVKPTTSGCVWIDSTGSWFVADCSTTLSASLCAMQAMKDCKDWRVFGQTKSTTYFIYALSDIHTVLCNMDTAGGGWTVMQNRLDASVHFWNRTWSEYKNGFGDGSSEATNSWMSMDLISDMTKEDTDLRIELWGDRVPNSKHSNDYWWNEYIHFKDESTNYTLQVSLDWANVPGNASAAWYDITYSSGKQFSTIDRINDPMTKCVTDYHLSGWWLSNCAFSSLNGEYVPPIAYGDGYGMFWLVEDQKWKPGADYQYSINPRRSRMMFRRH